MMGMGTWLKIPQMTREDDLGWWWVVMGQTLPQQADTPHTHRGSGLARGEVLRAVCLGHVLYHRGCCCRSHCQMDGVEGGSPLLLVSAAAAAAAAVGMGDDGGQVVPQQQQRWWWRRRSCQAQCIYPTIRPLPALKTKAKFPCPVLIPGPSCGCWLCVQCMCECGRDVCWI